MEDSVYGFNFDERIIGDVHCQVGTQAIDCIGKNQDIVHDGNAQVVSIVNVTIAFKGAVTCHDQLDFLPVIAEFDAADLQAAAVQKGIVGVFCAVWHKK